MTKEEAIDLVYDLIAEVRTYDANPSKSNLKDYEAMKQKVIDALHNEGTPTPEVSPRDER